jgi:CheY-like chemotaxis protein
MPKLDGIKVLQRTRNEQILCVVIVLPSAAENVHLPRCVQLGAQYFYDKGAVSELL